jgi:hypothetical protein
VPVKYLVLACERRSKVLDEVSTAILGGAAAENVRITCTQSQLGLGKCYFL